MGYPCGRQSLQAGQDVDMRVVQRDQTREKVLRVAKQFERRFTISRLPNPDERQKAMLDDWLNHH